ncbi:MAG: ribosome-associated translation inhibitor RaiA [Leptospiraceae bacterium]|nr:ribosome-associated translation inhibitor RaiA [Leptospiraceae bacterium]
MEINYHWHNLESTDALKEYIDRKINKLTGHFNNLQSAVVRLKVEKIDHIVEITINADHEQFVATERNHDMYAAVDLVESKLEKQIRRNKEKVHDRIHKK